MRTSTVVLVFVGLSLLASANTQSTVSNAASQGQAVAKSAVGTITTSLKKEGQDVAKIVQAVLKQALGDANYQKLMALIGNLVKQIQAAVAGLKKKAEAAAAGMSGGSSKPFVDLWEELNTSPIMRSPVANAANQGAAIAKDALTTAGKDAQKELKDIIKIAEAILKKLIGDGNYQKLQAMLQKLIAAVQAAVKKLQASAQGAIGGIQKAMSGKAILQELSAQSTVAGAAKAGAATAQSGAKTLAADAQKELNLVVKVLEAILKKILGEANYKQLMAGINQLIGAAKNAAGQLAKAAQGAVAGIQKQMGGVKPVFGFEDASTQSTVTGAAKAGAATAQSAVKTLGADAQKELNLLIKVVEAILKQILGDANYKQLMAAINQLLAQAKNAAGQAQAAVGQIVKKAQGAVAGLQKQAQAGGAAAGGKPIFDLLQEASTQSTIQGAAKAGAATAQSAGKTLAADAQKELALVVGVLEAVLKQIVGEANYKKIMAFIGQLIAQLKQAAGKAQAAAGQAVKQIQAAVAGIQKQMAGAGGSAKPIDFSELSAQTTVAAAAKAGAATAQSGAKTLAADAQKELGLVVKVLEAIIKQLLGEANYKKLMAMIQQLIAQVKAAAAKAQAAVGQIVKQAQGAVAGLQKQAAGGAAAGGKPIFDLYQEASTQSTIQGAAKAGAATAQSAGKTLAADAQKEIGLLVKVLEAVLKQIVGEANYKKIMAFIGQLVAQLKKTAGQAQAAAGEAAKKLQAAVAGIQKQMGGAKPFDFSELSAQSTIQGAAKAGVATAQSGAKTLAADAQKELNLVVKVLEAVLKKILGEANYKQLMAMINQIIAQVKAAAGKAQAAAGQIVQKVQGAVAGLQKQASGAKPPVQDLSSTCAELLALKAPKTRCDCFQNVKYCWDYDYTELECGSC